MILSSSFSLILKRSGSSQTNTTTPFGYFLESSIKTRWGEKMIPSYLIHKKGYSGNNQMIQPQFGCFCHDLFGKNNVIEAEAGEEDGFFFSHI